MYLINVHFPLLELELTTAPCSTPQGFFDYYSNTLPKLTFAGWKSLIIIHLHILFLYSSFPLFNLVLCDEESHYATFSPLIQVFFGPKNLCLRPELHCIRWNALDFYVLCSQQCYTFLLLLLDAKF